MAEVTEGTISRQEALMSSAYHGNMAMAKYCVEEGVDIDAFDDKTGLTALHMAIGMNRTEIVRYLIEHGATIIPDRRGRWPSTIAAICEVDGDLCDLVADAEASVGDV